MTDDDRTVDADASTMDELRRMAADARSSSNGAEPVEDSTMQADESTMDELRRFAEEARRHTTSAETESAPQPAPASDGTVDADESTMAALRSYAAEARESTAASAEPTIDIPPPSAQRRATAHESGTVTDLPSLPDLRTPETEPRPRAVSTADDNHTVNRSAEPDLSSVRAPAVEPGAGAWRPPPRMVMPTEPERSAPVHHGPWRTVSIVLGVIAVALAAVVAFSVFTGGDDTPTDDSVPADSTPAVDDGGDGGG